MDIDYTKVAAKMKELRLEAGYKQDDIAEDLGVTVAYISNTENCRVKLNLKMLLYYSNLLNVGVQTFLDAGMEEPSGYTDTIVDQRILAEIHDRPENEKAKILKLLKIWKGLD